VLHSGRFFTNLSGHLKQEIGDIENFVLLLFPFVGHVDGDLGDLDVDEKLVLEKG
jgi:hypothetical protein